MRWIIDRFEGDFAVIESNGICFNIPKQALPSAVTEGDVLEISVNAEESEFKEKELKDRLKKLFGE